jgi:hypothetical protein
LIVSHITELGINVIINEQYACYIKMKIWRYSHWWSYARLY